MKNQIQTASEVKHSSNASTEAHETRKNKKGLALFVMTVANQSKAMEAETILKNGQSSKSCTSRRSFLNKLCFALFAAILIFSGGCSKDDDNGGKSSAFDGYINAKVVNGSDYNSLVSTVVAELWDERAEEIVLIATGNYKSGGFSISLPESVRSRLLDNVEDLFDSDDDVKISDPSANIASLVYFDAYDDYDEYVGYFWHGKEDRNSVIYVAYIYADRDVTITGKAEYEDNYSETYHLTLKEGWNIAYMTERDNEAELTTKEVSGVKWYFEEDDNGGGGSGTIPNAPTGVTPAAQMNKQLKETWSAVSGATGYEVYYEIGSSSTKNLAGTAYSTSYTHTGLQASTTYYYYIKAVNNAGSSSYSSSASATTSSGGGGSGTAVTFSNLTANGSSSQTTTQLTLTFSQAISGLTASDITLSGVSGVSKGTLSSSGATYTLPISGFTSGGTLTVSVSKSGYNISSSPRTVTIYYYTSGGGVNSPCPVTNTKATGNLTSISVSWSAATGTGCGTPTSYDVYKRNPTTGTYEVKSNRTTTSWTDSDPHPGINYYAVVAKNSAGSGSQTIIYTSEIPLATPAASAMNTISWGSGTQNLNIFIVSQKGATSYEVWYCQTASGTYSLLGTVKDSERLADYVNFTWNFPVARGSTWYFKIKSVYEDGIYNRVSSSLSPYKSYTLP